MKYVEHETSTTVNGEEYKWNVPVPVFDSVEEFIASLGEAGREDAEQGLTDLVNSYVRGSVLQGGKAPVRKALEGPEDGYDTADEAQEAFDAAVEGHRSWAEDFVPFAGARGRIAGVTKTQAGEVGKALLKANPEQLKALASELGLDLD